MATEIAQLLHLKAFDRVLGLPTVELALVKSVETYSRVKDSNQLVHWAFTIAEMSLNAASKPAVFMMPIAVPIAKMFESPINFVDYTLCFGLDKIEEKMPIVKEKPEEILKKATLSISHINDLIIIQATTVRDISWNKTNQILDTHYGSVAMRGLDSTAAVIDKLIDKFFPAKEEEEKQDIQEEDKLLYTLQTLGHLSNKAARRVYFNIIHHLNVINKYGLLVDYISNLVNFLRFTKYLNTVDKKILLVNDKKKEELQEKPKNE